MHTHTQRASAQHQQTTQKNTRCAAHLEQRAEALLAHGAREAVDHAPVRDDAAVVAVQLARALPAGDLQAAARDVEGVGDRLAGRAGERAAAEARGDLGAAEGV